MADKVYIVTDLGPGDGGKGGVVQFLAKKLHANWVIKEGGAQGSHGVLTAGGERFNFSQWGCGTLDGVPTYLSERFIVSPTGLYNEGVSLQKMGFNDPFALLNVDPNCLIATPLHQAWSQIDELLRKDKPRGTVGTGVGKAYREAMEHPEYALRVKDLMGLGYLDVLEHLEELRRRIIKLYDGFTPLDVLPEDTEAMMDALDFVREGSLFPVVNQFMEVRNKLHLAELADILKQPGVAILEKSHGILTDAECGFGIHTSAIRTLPKFSVQMLWDAGHRGEIRNIGVHRAYEIRHGAGPMPSYDAKMTAEFTDGHKEFNRWQGAVRVGPLDINLLRYALQCCEETPFDCLAITWFDQVMKASEWRICTGYSINDKWVVNYKDIQKMVFDVEKAGVDVWLVEVEKFRNDPRAMLDFCAYAMQHYVTTPVRLLSYGESETDKIII